MPLSWLSPLCLKVLVEPRGRSCAQRSCEPETGCHLFGSTAFCMQQTGCGTLSLQVQLCFPVRLLSRFTGSWLAGAPLNHEKKPSVFEFFHKVHHKSHFLTCNFLMCLLHVGLVRSDFLMDVLHFCFSFFLGCPDGLHERFSTILVALWEPLGRSLGVLGRHLGFLGACCDPRGVLGGHQVALWVSLLMLWRYLGISWGHFGGSSQL